MREPLARFVRCLPSAIPALVVLSCATQPPLPKAILAAYVGKPIDAAIQTWGRNFREREIDDGAHRFTWMYESKRIARTGQGLPEQGLFGVIVKPGTMDQPELVLERCTLDLVADARGKVTGWSAEGAACAYALGKPRLWHAR